MLNTPKILIIGPDPKLPREIDSALHGLGDVRAVTHWTPTFHQAVEAARCRRPDLALLEVSKNFQVLKQFAGELANASPETVLAAVYHPDAFAADYSESALFLESLRNGVRDCFRRPLSSTDLGQLLDRLLRKPEAQPAQHGVIVPFISNKGGVGKSSVSVNAACLLAKRSREPVLLIDASLQMGVCATMLNLHPTTTLTDAVRERHRLDETLIRQFTIAHECGLDLLAAPANAVEAMEVDDEALSRILTLARRAYRYVLVDTFPLLDRVMMAALDLSDRAYVVLESVVPTILGIAQLIEVLDGLGVPKERQRLVLNRYSTFAGNINPEGVARRLGRSIDHIIPYEKKLLVAANVGTPYVLSAGRFFSRFPRAIAQLVDEIEGLWVPSVQPATKSMTAMRSALMETDHRELPVVKVVTTKTSAAAETDNHEVIP